MPTSYVHRLLLIVPVAKVPAVVTWFQANVSIAGCTQAVDVAANWPGLNATGLVADPVTHRWCSGSWIDTDCKAILLKCCQLASVTPPTAPQWAGWTRPQKISWLQSVQAGLLSGYGIGVWLSNNEGPWDDAVNAAASMGLQVIQTGP
jgi:hypothetical protein